jgi:hypothetical protein
MKRRYRACKCEGTAKVSDENSFFFMKPCCIELIKLLIVKKSTINYLMIFSRISHTIDVNEKGL